MVKVIGTNIPNRTKFRSILNRDIKLFANCKNTYTFISKGNINTSYFQFF